MILSVCPPHAALDVAARSPPGTSAASTSTATRCRPPLPARSLASSRRPARLRGRRHHRPAARQGRHHPAVPVRPDAERVRPLFAAGPLEAVVLSGDLTAASAIKMAYAAWTKGSQALLMAVRALATAEGVDGRWWRSGCARSPTCPSARRTPPRAPRARRGGGSARWTRSRPRSPGPACPTASTGGQRAVPSHGDLQGRAGATVDRGCRQDPARGASRMSVTSARPIAGPMVWRGEDLARSTDWIRAVTPVRSTSSTPPCGPCSGAASAGAR